MADTNDTLAKTATGETHEHPPATAEDFEHTLRRLVAERDKTRAGKPVNYK